VEIRSFSIDFVYPEAALFLDGRVLRSRMNTGVSRSSLQPAHFMRPVFPWQKPLNNGSPKGLAHKEKPTMAAGLTKTALTRHMAEKLELTNKQSAAFLDLLAETAIKETKKNGVFVIPGIGRLVKAERKARMGRNPQTGEAIKIKAKTVVKFRVAKSAKDVIAPPKK
jgi:DNA-binding protein HU-beta